jgi:hypothetical protein
MLRTRSRTTHAVALTAAAGLIVAGVTGGKQRPSRGTRCGPAATTSVPVKK